MSWPGLDKDFFKISSTMETKRFGNLFIPKKENVVWFYPQFERKERKRKMKEKSGIGRL